MKGEEVQVLNMKLIDLYRKYIDCLNAQDWAHLGQYIHHDVTYNGAPQGLSNYTKARQEEFRTIPDLHFAVDIVTVNEHTVGSRLMFNISPQGDFLGLPVNGRRISFCEHVFYQFENDKIISVWSVLDKAAIALQLDR